MLEAVIGLVGAIVGAYVQASYSSREARQKQIEELAAYLKELASCLNEMVEKLSKDEVPTTAGNRIEKAFESFEAKLENVKLSKAKQGELAYAQQRLEQCLSDGRFLDDVIRGHILRSHDPTEKARILLEMARTSGYLGGVADTLNI
jgi:hypothetical protein